MMNLTSKICSYPIICCIIYLLQRNLIREATAFLLDVLKPNLPEHAYLQTKVSLSVNVVNKILICLSYLLG